MSLEYLILIGVWLLSVLLLFTIPREKIRLSLVAILFKQAITYLFGLVVVELGLLSYPVREMADINRTSFTYEYLAFPIVCGLFVAFYPSKKGRWYQLGYYVVFSTTLTIIEVLIEKYTDLIRYIHWNGLTTWVTLMVTFYLTKLFCTWFFIDLRFRDAASR
jgi:hypothetical protein